MELEMQSRFLRYGLTALIISLALACQLLVYEVTPVNAPFMFFAFIVILTTWLLGWRAGVLATVLSTAVVEYFFIHPVGFYLRSPVGYLTSLIFLAGTGFIVFLVEAKRRSDEKLADLNNKLAERVAERTEALERAMKELTAKQALASVGVAAASIAHEIANPLHTLSLGVQLLERELTKNGQTLDETVGTELAAIQTQVSHLLTLLADLRDVSRPMKLKLSPVNLKRELREVLLSHEPLFAERRVQVVDHLSDDLPPVMADAGKLKQVIFNLCKNAVEAMPDGGTLTLCAHTDPGYVCFEVHDTGHGIPEGANIFEAFATSKSEGWGLGLPIVYQIISAHNGRVEYHSTPGDGTTFRVRLPTANNSEAAA
jgi:signal transduction histidine kinase